MKIRVLVILTSLFFSSPSFAFELIKCSTVDQRTLWGSFGRAYSSSDPNPTYFPTELTVFSGDHLLSRNTFPNLQDALRVKVAFNGDSIRFAFDINGEANTLDLSRNSVQDEAAFLGTWQRGNSRHVQTFCTVR